MSRIVIVGGHGKVALRLERLLADRGDEPVGVIRDPAQAADVERAGGRALVADVETLDVDALARLFVDAAADAIVWSAGAGGGDPARTVAVDREAAIRSMDAARDAGVERYVMVSYFSAGRDHGVPESDPFFPYAEAKAAADEHLRQSPLAWTILGPSTLVDGLGTGRIDTASAESGSVDRADVAAVLVDPRTIGRTIRFNHGDTPIATAIVAG